MLADSVRTSAPGGTCDQGFGGRGEGGGERVPAGGLGGVVIRSRTGDRPRVVHMLLMHEPLLHALLRVHLEPSVSLGMQVLETQ